MLLQPNLSFTKPAMLKGLTLLANKSSSLSSVAGAGAKAWAENIVPLLMTQLRHVGQALKKSPTPRWVLDVVNPDTSFQRSLQFEETGDIPSAQPDPAIDIDDAEQSEPEIPPFQLAASPSTATLTALPSSSVPSSSLPSSTLPSSTLPSSAAYVFGYSLEHSSAWRTKLINGKPSGSRDFSKDFFIGKNGLDEDGTMCRWPDGMEMAINAYPVKVFKLMAAAVITKKPSKCEKKKKPSKCEEEKEKIPEKDQDSWSMQDGTKIKLVFMQDRVPIFVLKVNGRSKCQIRRDLFEDEQKSKSIMLQIAEKLSKGEINYENKELYTERDNLIRAAGGPPVKPSSSTPKAKKVKTKEETNSITEFMSGMPPELPDLF